ncbi:unnamed protein product [Closterium sp. NIES-54]
MASPQLQPRPPVAGGMADSSRPAAVNQGYSLASSWEHNAPLSERQLATIAMLANVAGNRSLPPHLEGDGKEGREESAATAAGAVGGEGGADDGEEGEEESDMLLLVNSHQFYKWHSDLETAMKSETEEKYRQYVCVLETHLQTCDHILMQLDSTLAQFDELQAQHRGVASKTRTLHDACERLVADKERLVEFADALRSKLNYFEELDKITSRFHSASMSVSSSHFLPLLKRLDECITYVASNLQYADANIYLVKFRQLQHFRPFPSLFNAPLTLPTYSLCSLWLLRQFLSQTPVPFCDPRITRHFFLSVSVHLITLCPRLFLARSWPLQSPLLALLHSTSPPSPPLSPYSPSLPFSSSSFPLPSFPPFPLPPFPASPLPLFPPSPPAPQSACQVLAAMKESGVPLGARGSGGGISEGAETSLLYVRFKAAAGELKPLMEEMEGRASRREYSQLLSDCHTIYCEQRLALVQPVVQQRITDFARRETLPTLTRSGCAYLMQLVDIVHADLLHHHLPRRGEWVAALRPTIARILADLRQRLIFRAHTFMRDEISNYVPTSDDLDYPGKLQRAAAKSAAAAAAAVQVWVVGWGCGEGDPQAAGAEEQGGDSYAGWYPPLESTLACLSKLYRCVDADIFTGLAQEAVAVCSDSIQASFLSLTSGESFLRFSPRVTESHIDAKKELEKLLKSTCEQLIMSVTKLTVEPILSFITKVTAVRVAGSALALKARGGDAAAAGGEGHAGQRLLREQAFASPEKLAQVVKQVDEALKVSLPGVVANMALSLPVPHTALLTLLLILPPLPLSPIFFTTPSSPQVDEALKVSLPDVVANMALSLPLPHTAAVHPSQLSPFHKPPPLPTPALQVDEALKVSLPDVVANMALYLPHAATRAILFRPIKSNILEAHAQLQSLVDSEYTEEDRAVVGLISSADLVTFLDGLT